MAIASGMAPIFCLHAQEQLDSPTAKERKGPPAHVRIWAMVYDENTPFAVKAKAAQGDPIVLIETDGKIPNRSSYVELPKGQTDLSLLSAGTPVKSEKIELKPDDYRTILISRKNGVLSWEVLQDPIPKQKDFPPAVRLLNFGSDRVADVQIGAQPLVKVQPNSFVVAPLTESGTVNINVSLPDPKGGPPATSITDFSTAVSPSWSVVVIPDYRGKLRPRISPDGKD